MLDRDSPGAAAQLTSFYDAYAADAFRYALHLTGRREDAEDVVQHVFLQAYATLQAGHELVNPRAWLTKATKHRSLNLIRDRRDTPSAELDPPAPFSPGAGEAEALAEVRAALWSLPEAQHHAFVLRHWSGLSQDEIADVLATTPGAVESLLVRARATLVAEREEGDSECAGVRGRLARMLVPTSSQAVHLASCRRCRTAQTRLLRAAEFATTFALVPSPHVLHGLAAAIPGFGASGAAAGASATGAAAGTGTGGGAVSTVSAATKVGILTKVAVAATTAAVAVTAVHPLRTAVAHAIFHPAPAKSAAPAPKRPAAHTTASHATGSARADASAPVGMPAAPPSTGGAGTTAAPTTDPPAKTGGGKGKSGTAGTNGNGGGNGNGGASGGTTRGKSATAPGRTKTAGGPATGKGNANGNGAKSNGGGATTAPGKTKTNPGGGATKTKPTGGGAANGTGNGNGPGTTGGAGNGSGNAGGSGNGNAGGDGKGNGKS